MSTGQVVFLIAFAAIVGLVSFFALYVLSSTMWGGRWYRVLRRDR
jgi:hypothetical protein